MKNNTYYILLEGESKEKLGFDSSILGDSTEKCFYPNKGFSKLTKIINSLPELLSKIDIFDDNNKKYTVEQFLKVIGKLKIQQH